MRLSCHSSITVCRFMILPLLFYFTLQQSLWSIDGSRLIKLSTLLAISPIATRIHNQPFSENPSGIRIIFLTISQSHRIALHYLSVNGRRRLRRDQYRNVTNPYHITLFADLVFFSELKVSHFFKCSGFIHSHEGRPTSDDLMIVRGSEYVGVMNI